MLMIKSHDEIKMLDVDIIGKMKMLLLYFFPRYIRAMIFPSPLHNLIFFPNRLDKLPPPPKKKVGGDKEL